MSWLNSAIYSVFLIAIKNQSFKSKLKFLLTSFQQICIAEMKMAESKHISVWNECLRIFENVLDGQEFSTWFRPIKPVKLENADLTVEVASDFCRDYIETHYLNLVSKTLHRVLGADARLFYQFRVVKSNSDMRVSATSAVAPTNKTVNIPTASHMGNPGAYIYPGTQPVRINPQLNPVYNFSNLIIGACNKMGITAGINIADAPGMTPFNPLFLFGGPGLGKTHIAQAIGLEIKNKFPEKIVLYVSANRFKTQYMKAVTAKNQLADFLAFYQKIDVLIVDDIQELNSPGAKNAFFHVFNHLHQNGKQLIFTSDRPQVQLEEFENRLLSRLKWGLSVELTAPDFKTRLEMLHARALREGASIADEVLEYIAAHITSNFRELEGALISLIANVTFNHQEATIPMARKIVEMIVDEPQLELTMDKVEAAVCEYFEISTEELHSRSRKRKIAQARQIAMYLSRSLTQASLASIGQQFGGRDHATVLHSCNTISDLLESDRGIKQYVSEIQKLIIKAS